MLWLSRRGPLTCFVHGMDRAVAGLAGVMGKLLQATEASVKTSLPLCCRRKSSNTDVSNGVQQEAALALRVSQLPGAPCAQKAKASMPL